VAGGAAQAATAVGRNGLDAQPATFNRFALVDVNPNNVPLRGLGIYEPAEFTFVTPNAGTVSGGLQHNGQGYADYTINNGEGFDLYLYPEGAEKSYEVFLYSYLGTSTATVHAGLNEYGSITLSNLVPTKLTIHTTGSEFVWLRATMTAAQPEWTSANLAIGAVNVVAVPEPQLNCFLAFVALLAAVYLMTVTNCFLPPPPR
jgi:hypothetical protein